MKRQEIEDDLRRVVELERLNNGMPEPLKILCRETYENWLLHQHDPTWRQ